MDVHKSREVPKFQVAKSDLSPVHRDGGQLLGPHLESEVALARKKRLENQSSKDQNNFQVKGLLAIKAPTLFKAHSIVRQPKPSISQCLVCNKNSLTKEEGRHEE